jgi:hypothetical protein
MVSRQAGRRHCKMCNRRWKPWASNSLARRLIGLVSEFLLRRLRQVKTSLEGLTPAYYRSFGRIT